MRKSLTINLFDVEYILEPAQDPTAFSFHVLEVEYQVHEILETKNLQVVGVTLSRCPNGCDGCADGFTSINEAVQFADLYERSVKFAFETEESKETAIQRLSNIIEDIKLMSKPSN